MNFKIKINNIGKLKEADISVRPLTILAGPNNAGKSFFSKTLYSVFHVMSANPVSAYMKDFLYPLQRGVMLIWRGLYDRKVYIEGYIEDYVENNIVDEDEIEQEQNELKELNNLGKKIKAIELAEKRLTESISSSKDEQIIRSAHPGIGEGLNKIIKLYKDLLKDKNFRKKKTDSQILDNEKHQILDEKGLEKVKSYLKDLEERESSDKSLRPEELIAKGFSKILENNLTGNFQISNLRKLKGDYMKPSFINIGSQAKNSGDSNNPDICGVTIEDNKINLHLSLKGLDTLRDSSRVLYIESPFYWKLRNALGKNDHFSFLPVRKSLLVPKYFDDLDIMLKDELLGDMAFPGIFKDIIEIIKGKMAVDESGTLQFKESKGKAHSLPMTATGIVQLGFLALLIEKKILDKGTVLFIDEPETNLHPAWQVEMMKVLFKLVKAGAYVIMATHSVDMLKWLEEHLKTHPKDSNLIALNQMKINEEDGTASIVDSDDNIEIKIKSIKEHLTEPFLRLFLEGQKSE
ncbi:MAG: AAA family ATPase [Bdellovibrionales bacterium]|nr:AAA family ATPase [Bdellovibrionales bacterium]